MYYDKFISSYKFQGICIVCCTFSVRLNHMVSLPRWLVPRWPNHKISNFNYPSSISAAHAQKPNLHCIIIIFFFRDTILFLLSDFCSSSLCYQSSSPLPALVSSICGLYTSILPAIKPPISLFLYHMSHAWKELSWPPLHAVPLPLMSPERDKTSCGGGDPGSHLELGDARLLHEWWVSTGAGYTFRVLWNAGEPD